MPGQPMKVTELPKELRTCLECDSSRIEIIDRDVEFDYGGREKPFHVKAKLPFVVCRDCGAEFLAGDDPEMKHDAACRQLGVMTPAEIVALRKKIDLTQRELAELTGIGEASISRWERGLLIQNESHDQLLFLLQFPDNVERLRQRKVAPSPPVGHDRGLPLQRFAPAHLNRMWKRIRRESYACIRGESYASLELNLPRN